MIRFPHPSRRRQGWRRGLLGLLAAVGIHGALAAPLPAALHGAETLAALDDGRWLAAREDAVQLLDADGRVRAAIAMRVEAMDSRPTPGGALMAVLDADSQQTLVVEVDGAAGRLRVSDRLPSPPFGLESLCLYRDPRGLDFVYLLGKEGWAEQWLLSGPTPRRMRRLALPVGAEQCQVDDVAQWLYLAQEDLGLWAVPADGEQVPAPRLIAAAAPWGDLGEGPGALLAVPGGVVMSDADGGRLRLWRTTDAGWQAAPIGSAERVHRLARQGARLLVAGKDGAWRQADGPALPASAAVPEASPVIPARGQTAPVGRFGDAADDPAIWIHPTDPARSRLLGTDKKWGLLSYDLAGHELQALGVGRLNNVDVRQQVRLGGQWVDLAVATHRDQSALAIFEIDADGVLHDKGRAPTGLGDLYGVCLYQPAGGGLEVFANDTDGRFVHMRIAADGDGYRAERLRAFAFDGQAEGCVVDDAQGRLFVAEEKAGLWVMSAAAASAAAPRLILPVAPGRLQADAEGLALYHGAAGSYLVASSQGDSHYVVLDARPPYAYRGRFRIGIHPALGIDGTSDTDGLEVSSANLGGVFERGLMVVQDGRKRLPDGAQNFKVVAWRDIARALALP